MRTKLSSLKARLYASLITDPADYTVSYIRLLVQLLRAFT